jgi:ribosome maturation protein Sdo1
MKAYDAVSKVFYKGASDDFIVIIEDPAALKNWKNDRSIPLSDVVNGFHIFVTHRYVPSSQFHISVGASVLTKWRGDCRHGSQGVLDTASNASLENEFKTHNVDECITKILEMGTYQTYVVCFSFFSS